MYNSALYEKPELRKITGSTLHPGGLELTRRGLSLCAFQKGDIILDIGCGPGESLNLMRSLGFKAYGLDHSAKLLQEAAMHGPVIFGNALNIPLKNTVLQGATLECVLSLMPDKSALLREIRRVLQPGGRLLLSDLFLKNSSGAKPAISSACGAANPEHIASNISAKKNTGQDAAAANLTQHCSCITGAEPLATLLELVKNAGFSIVHCSEENDCLKQLAVNMIFKYGSTDAFFAHWGLQNGSCGQNGKNLGYALIVAKAI